MSKELKERLAKEQELKKAADRAFKSRVYMGTNAVILTLIAWAIILVFGGGMLWLVLWGISVL